MSDPIRTAQGMYFSKLSEITPNMGEISAGTHRTGDDYGRQVIYGDDVNGLSGFDQYRRIYYRLSEVNDYWRVGIEGYPDAYWNPTEGLVLDGLALKPNSVTYDKFIVGPFAYGLLKDDVLEADRWRFAIGSLGSTDESGIANIEFDLDTGDIVTPISGSTTNKLTLGNGIFKIQNLYPIDSGASRSHILLYSYDSNNSYETQIYQDGQRVLFDALGQFSENTEIALITGAELLVTLSRNNLILYTDIVTSYGADSSGALIDTSAADTRIRSRTIGPGDVEDYTLTAHVRSDALELAGGYLRFGPSDAGAWATSPATSRYEEGLMWWNALEHRLEGYDGTNHFYVQVTVI